jgi:penicillin-binding protein 1C
VHFADGLEPDRDEWFLAGTEIATVTVVAAPAGRARLESPSNGAIYALDPDIPAAQQRLAVRARGAAPGTRFAFADGQSADATRTLLWEPAPGRHRIALTDATGRELDQVSFEVRGTR